MRAMTGKNVVGARDKQKIMSSGHHNHGIQTGSTSGETALLELLSVLN